jgi:hypothetical protein
MNNTQTNLLPLLKAELKFAESGGYRKPSWHPPLIFQDSPICPNYFDPANTTRCHECPLLAFVPAQHRDDRLPCRHILLNDQGETLDSLYRSATNSEIEATLIRWLKVRIQQLEGKAAGAS